MEIFASMEQALASKRTDAEPHEGSEETEAPSDTAVFVRLSVLQHGGTFIIDCFTYVHLFVMICI